MANVVQHSVGRPISVTVYRNGEGVKALHLIPARWSGQGLLGYELMMIFRLELRRHIDCSLVALHVAVSARLQVPSHTDRLTSASLVLFALATLALK